jgi:hypothetical protein
MTADSTSVKYLCDGLDRLAARQDVAANGVTSTVVFFHDRQASETTVERYPVTATVVARYVLDSQGDPIAQEKDRVVGFYVEDSRGNLAQVIDATETVKSSYTYDPFGKAKSTKTTSSSWDSRLKFQMSPQDPKTGVTTSVPGSTTPRSIAS